MLICVVPFNARPKDPEGVVDELFSAHFREPLSLPRCCEQAPDNIRQPRRPHVAGAGFSRIPKSALISALLSAVDPRGSFDEIDIPSTPDAFLSFVSENPPQQSSSWPWCSVDRTCAVVGGVEPLNAQDFVEIERELFWSLRKES